MNRTFYSKMKKDQLYINEYIKDLKDYFYDLQDMRRNPEVQATWTYSKMKRANKSDKVISKKLEREHYKYFKRYPHLINTTMILLAYSFLEGYLEDLSYTCGQNFKHIEESDLRKIHIDIERSKTQIEKIAQVSFKKLSKEWNVIHLFREIRNCVLHFNSNVGRMNNVDLLKRLENSKQFEITKHGFIRVRKYKVIYDFIETIYKYLEGILIILSAGKLKSLPIITDWELHIKEVVKKYPNSEHTKYFISTYQEFLKF